MELDTTESRVNTLLDPYVQPPNTVNEGDKFKVVHWPEEELQLGVEVPDERASGDYLSVAVVER